MIDFELREPPFINLTITNLGTMAARDVIFRFDQPLVTALDDRRGDDRPSFADLPIFRDGISTLPPGKTIRTFFDSYPARVEAGYPNRYVATLDYAVPITSYPSFTDEYVLDLEIYRELAYSKEPSLKDVSKQLEQIAKTISKWGSSWGGIKTVTTTEERELHERHLARIQQQRSESDG